MSRATLGFSRVTRARTRQNPHPRLRARVFVGRGLPPEMTNKPRKGSASVNRHCRATLRGSESHGLTTRRGGAYPLRRIEIETKIKRGGIHPPHWGRQNEEAYPPRRAEIETKTGRGPSRLSHRSGGPRWCGW